MGVMRRSWGSQRALLEVVQVDLGVVPGDQPLHLGRGEHVQPLGVDDAAEAADEGARLLLDLRVHPEVGHEVDVADPADGTTPLDELQRRRIAVLTFTSRAFSRRFYPERLTISAFVRRKRINNTTLSVQ